jgi:hypothetical protein
MHGYMTSISCGNAEQQGSSARLNLKIIGENAGGYSKVVHIGWREYRSRQSFDYPQIVERRED